MNTKPFTSGLDENAVVITRVADRQWHALDDDLVVGRGYAEHRPDGRLFVSIDAWHDATFDRLAEAMPPGAELRLATDDPSYLVWMLEHATAHPGFVWLARRSGDWRERPPDWPPTRYEAKARAAGRTPVFLRFARR